MIVSVENLKESTTTKLLELISDYSKASGYKVTMQKLVAFLCTSHEQVELEIKNTIPFTLAPPKMEYLDINLRRCTQNISEENCKTE